MQVDKLKQMDDGAWEALLAEYASRLHRDIMASLRKRGLKGDMAEDIQQQTWLTAVQKIHIFFDQGEDKLYRWLRAISCNHVRRLQRERYVESSDDMEEQRPSQAQGVEEQVIRREQMERIHRALDDLKPQPRRLVLRALMDSEKPEQLAKSFPHLKLHSISQAVYRAKQRVRVACAEF